MSLGAGDIKVCNLYIFYAFSIWESIFTLHHLRNCVSFNLLLCCYPIYDQITSMLSFDKDPTHRLILQPSTLSWPYVGSPRYIVCDGTTYLFGCGSLHIRVWGWLLVRSTLLKGISSCVVWITANFSVGTISRRWISRFSLPSTLILLVVEWVWLVCLWFFILCFITILCSRIFTHKTNRSSSKSMNCDTLVLVYALVYDFCVCMVCKQYMLDDDDVYSHNNTNFISTS